MIKAHAPGTLVSIKPSFYTERKEIPPLRMHFVVIEVINWDLPAYEISYPPLSLYIAHEHLEVCEYN